MRDARLKVFALGLLWGICANLVFSGCSSTPPPNLLATSVAEHQFPPFDDELTQRYVEGIAVRLTQSAFARQAAYERGIQPLRMPRIVLTTTKDAVALSLPPETLILSRGMLTSLRNESQLAFVLAHELGHRQLGHHELLAGEEISARERKRLELAADARAIALVAAAGYDPRTAIGALHFTHRETLLAGSNTHPDLIARQSAAIELIESSGWTPPGIVNRRDFTLIQQRASYFLRENVSHR